jgi:glycosyltransferase involved in cell wall biosynthesis
LTLICRPIPENSIAELVQGFSRRPRGYKLAVLGEYAPAEDPYHQRVIDAASDEVVFLGPIYDKAEVEALRFHSAAYLHGHTVGGTNPSLVEAMAAGNPVIAHDNPYNRWVAQDAAVYFSTEHDVSNRLDEILASPAQLERMRAASRRRHDAEFTWEHVAGQYEQLLLRFLPDSGARSAEPVALELTS